MNHVDPTLATLRDCGVGREGFGAFDYVQLLHAECVARAQHRGAVVGIVRRIHHQRNR